MYQRKHHKRSHRRSGKSITLLVSLLLIIGVTVGGTIAFLMDSDGPLHNLFDPSKVTTKVEETLSGNTKKDVKIQNTGDTEAWIRAAVVVTWQDKDGNVYGKKPVEGTDYGIKWGDDSWLLGADGFYYYESPVKSVKEAPKNCTTEFLIDSVSPISSANNTEANELGYYLTIEIIGSGIQSKPSSVYTDEWSESSQLYLTTDGTLLVKNY